MYGYSTPKLSVSDGIATHQYYKNIFSMTTLRYQICFAANFFSGYCFEFLSPPPTVLPLPSSFYLLILSYFFIAPQVGTPVTAESFAKWTVAKAARKQAEAEARVKAEQAKKKGGKGLCKYFIFLVYFFR